MRDRVLVGEAAVPVCVVLGHVSLFAFAVDQLCCWFCLSLVYLYVL